jgi:hypothetical protein
MKKKRTTSEVARSQDQPKSKGATESRKQTKAKPRAGRMDEPPMEIFSTEDFVQVSHPTVPEVFDRPQVRLSRHTIYFNHVLIEHAKAHNAKYVSFHTNESSKLLGFTFHKEEPTEGSPQKLKNSSREKGAKQASAAELTAHHPWIAEVFKRENEESRQFEVFQRTDDIWAADLEPGGEIRKAA